MNFLKVKVLHPDAMLPVQATDGSVGYDLYAYIKEEIVINPQQTIKIPTAIAIELESGYGAFIFARSSLGIKYNIVPANCVGVIDNDYTGEVIVGLMNQSSEPYVVRPKDKIAQMVIMRCETPKIILCNELKETERGEKGFGSTGV